MRKNNSGSDNIPCGEYASLWSTYQYETIHRCGIIYFLQHVEDQSIQELLQDSLNITDKRLREMKQLFAKYNLITPQAFDEGDIDLNAPRLFSDKLYLHYILQTLILEATTYNECKKEAINDDMILFFHQSIQETLNLERKAKSLAIKQGAFTPSPTIPKQTKIDFVKKDSFLAGWFGDKRPLIGIEITQLIAHSRMNALGQAVITAFSQVATSKEVRRFFEKGREIAAKHFNVLSDTLHNDNLPDPSLLLTAEVTNSREAPFSDKLMTVFITELISISIGSYGMSIAMSPRKDLGVMYSRLVGEIIKYANEGSELLIKNGWMEQPPIAANRKNLAR